MAMHIKQRSLEAKYDKREGWHSRGYLPHLDREGITQHLCFRLFDSLPRHELERWREELKHMTQNDFALEQLKRIEKFLDTGYGNCFLRDDRLAEIVQNALLYFDGRRYTLHAWCVMPNHVHVLFTPKTGFSMSGIAHSWKSYTANKCNKVLGRTGSFWRKESFDRSIRNERHFQNTIVYIEKNPVNAGLAEKPDDWKWSSARWRLNLVQHASNVLEAGTVAGESNEQDPDSNQVQMFTLEE
jgi:REP element-mobilizing transposase RayT